MSTIYSLRFLKSEGKSTPRARLNQGMGVGNSGWKSTQREFGYIAEVNTSGPVTVVAADHNTHTADRNERAARGRHVLEDAVPSIAVEDGEAVVVGDEEIGEPSSS
jgi:hypothetical protein